MLNKQVSVFNVFVCVCDASQAFNIFTKKPSIQ